MGSVIYNFLADSMFFHQDSIENNFANENDTRIKKELEEYRNFCIANYETLIKEIVDRDSFLKVFSSLEYTPLNLLKQTALYVDQFIIKDPLFNLTDTKSDLVNATAKSLGFQDDSFVNRKDIKDAAVFLKQIVPMIMGNYVKIFPLSYHFEVPKQLPILVPINHYKDVLPKEIMDFFWENVSVCSMKKTETGHWQPINNQLYPCRSIFINFGKADYTPSAVYHLLETELLDFDEKTQLGTFRQSLPDTPPNADYFDNWVAQSINSASIAFFDRVFKENIIASNLNSTYLCNNDFTSRLVTQNLRGEKTIQTETASRIINFELPFLDNIDINKLMDVREFDADIFTNFRIELEKHFRELRILNDSELIKKKTENIFHELNDVQVQKIKQKLEYLQKQVITNSLIGLGGLVGGFATGGYSLLATGLALGKGYKDYIDYKEKVKENPSYLLWKVRKSS